jgi:hypothetical protein
MPERLTVKQRYETLAARYFETNDRWHLLQGWALATAVWWTTSSGATRDGVSETWNGYLAACTKDLSKYWTSAYIDEKDYCRRCGERYSVDNMSMCTDCFDGYWWRCVGGTEHHPNGNHRCGCGGELVG